jgi:spermidine synthase
VSKTRGIYGRSRETFLYPLLLAIFFASGFAALIYQIVWQRALFTIFGTNVEAVTVVVTGFLLGLGVGGLFGGWLSRTSTIRLLAIFGLIEIAIGTFGAISLHVFQWAGARTINSPIITVAAVTLLLVIVPTLFMGATLPLLTQHFVQRSMNVGRSVGILYSINTLGSAVACFVTAYGLAHLLGMQILVLIAAAINVLVGSAGLSLAYWHRDQSQAAPAYLAHELPRTFSSERKSKIVFACIVSMLAGYVSLSYEVIWFRAFLIGINQSQAFAMILGAYLGGLAVGSWWVRRYFVAKPVNAQLFYMLCVVILLSCLFGFSVLPLASRAASFGGWDAFVFVALVLVFMQTAIAGIAFPLLCHVSFTADAKAGFHLGLVYFSNILGSAAGTFITGFILMDRISTPQISAFVTALGAIAAAAVAGLAAMSWSRRATFIVLGFIVVVVVVGSPFTTKALFNHYYERIIYKGQFGKEPAFVDVVENKSGVVTANTNGVVYGNGMYDGMAYIDLVDDKNQLIRPFSLALYHPRPREVLMIGLGSGAWAQVIVNNPEVERLTIVEINPDYRSLLAKFPAVMTILSNPKLEIIIDDGRRWMNRHPNRKFDAIVQNTTFSYRPNVTNLLSTEYLHLAGSHLREGGVLMYNTTGSNRAQRTGCAVFPYAVREFNVMVASKEPLQIDPGRLKAVLENYSIDGHRVLDLTNLIHRARLEEIIAAVDPYASVQNGPEGMTETCESIMSRTQDLPLITDDNMGEEWQRFSIRTFPRGIISIFSNLWYHPDH